MSAICVSCGRRRALGEGRRCELCKGLDRSVKDAADAVGRRVRRAIRSAEISDGVNWKARAQAAESALSSLSLVAEQMAGAGGDICDNRGRRPAGFYRQVSDEAISNLNQALSSYRAVKNG